MTPSPAPFPERAKGKVVYIDHLKVALTVLVILHHAFITYGAPGGWYYFERTTLKIPLFAMTAFVAVNQAFFMGFFFFLSALFISSSYNKKGPLKFTADRLIRLGIPLLFYSFVLSPVLSYLNYNFGEGHHITYFQYLSGFNSWVDFGVLWFVAALLVFTLAYVCYRLVINKSYTNKNIPSIKTILLFALSIGAITYLVRIIFPVGWVLKPLGFQLGHFPQYIALFVFGIVAAKNKWLDNASYLLGKKTAFISGALIMIGFPAFFVAKSILHYPMERYIIGGAWQALWYAVWEQVTGFTIVTALICLGKHYWNNPSPFLSKMARSTFAVYIFHPLVLIGLSVAIAGWHVEPVIKLLIVAPLSVALSFLLGSLIVKIPGVKNII